MRRFHKRLKQIVAVAFLVGGAANLVRLVGWPEDSDDSRMISALMVVFCLVMAVSNWLDSRAEE